MGVQFKLESVSSLLRISHYRRGNFWVAVRVTNNEFALEFVVPDAEWLSADIRESLEAHTESLSSYIERENQSHL